LARRKGLFGPVKVPTPLRAGGFRNLQATATDGSESRKLEPVAAPIKRTERFRLQPVKHSESSTLD